MPTNHKTLKHCVLFLFVSIILLNYSSSFFNLDYKKNIDKLAKTHNNLTKNVIPSCKNIKKCLESANNLITRNQIEILKERIKRVMFCDYENSRNDSGCYRYADYISTPERLISYLVFFHSLNSSMLNLQHSYMKTYFDFFMITKDYKSTLLSLANKEPENIKTVLKTNIYEIFVLFDCFKKALKKTNFKKFLDKDTVLYSIYDIGIESKLYRLNKNSINKSLISPNPMVFSNKGNYVITNLDPNKENTIFIIKNGENCSLKKIGMSNDNMSKFSVIHKESRYLLNINSQFKIVRYRKINNNHYYGLLCVDYVKYDNNLLYSVYLSNYNN